MSPQAAYVHVPFCAHRCGYCNFTLVAGRDDLIESYLSAIEIELAQLESPRPVRTLYFGGGTPTQLSCDQFERLAGIALSWHPLLADYEWTVEANPNDVTTERIGSLARCGVTRLSLGAQSFNRGKLRNLERDHAAEDIIRSVELARQATVDVSLDLIFAAPGETLPEWQNDLDNAVQLQTDHISTYGLTFEQGTSFGSRFAAGELVPASDEVEREMYEEAIDVLTSAGFEHYEVSNFAKPGHRSRHNQVYWSGDEYFAAGPGAARFVDGVRETNHRSTTTWLNRVLAGESPVADRETLTSEARARELLVFGLRRLEGVARDDFLNRTGVEFDDLVAAPLRKFVENSLLQDDGRTIRLTREGLLVSDAMWPEFL